MQKEGAVFLTSPRPLSGPPPVKGAFGQTLDLAAATAAPSTPTLPRVGVVCAGATSLTMLSFPALLLQAKLGAQTQNRVILQPTGFSGVEVGGCGATGVNTQQQSSQRHQTTQQPVPTLQLLDYLPSLD